MTQEKIYNVQTGETVFIDETPERLAELEAGAIRVKKELAEQEIIDKKREAAEAKLAALGLDADDLKALGLV